MSKNYRRGQKHCTVNTQKTCVFEQAQRYYMKKGGMPISVFFVVDTITKFVLSYRKKYNINDWEIKFADYILKAKIRNSWYTRGCKNIDLFLLIKA